MSKLERLNARVAKLLTVAVHEVLEVVKETVSEYQDKTARTLRENESLKRRLQELQDRLKIESAAATLVSHPVSGGRAAIENPQPEETWSPGYRLEDPEPTPSDNQSDLSQDYLLKLRQEDYKEVDLDLVDSECTFRLMESEGLREPPEDPLPQAEGDASYLTAHALKRDVDTDSVRPLASPSAQPAGTSQLKTKLGLNLTIIKTEPEPDECRTVTEPQTVPVSDNCVDLSCNSTRHDAAMKCQENAAPDGLFLLYPNQNSVSRRFGFGKNRAALDVMRNRQHFRRDELHVCFVCGKTFSRVGNLRIHQRCHTGEKPYGCLQCGRSFRQAGDLKKHKRVHTGEKPYYCHQCGKSFSRGENLKRHQKIHIGESLQLQQVWRDHQSS